MIAKTIAALLAAVALPAAAQTATPRTDPSPGKARATESAPRTDGKVTARERARVAKAQNMESKCSTKQRHDRQKKATAT